MKNKNKKKCSALPKAENGLQNIQAKEARTRSLVNQGVSMAAEAALPGIGGAAISGLNAISSMTKDENGLYKSKFGQAVDGLNPVTQITRVATGVGKALKGDWKGLKDVDGQKAIKQAMASDKLDKEKKAYYGTLGADTQSMSQLTQFKKGTKSVATKPIEIEGGEPHFSKKVGGKRMLKQYHPDGPTHEQGGIPTIAAEGDAIVTAKKGMGAKAVQAYQKGDHKEVEKIINKMPEDKPVKKKRAGVADVDPKKAAAKALQEELNTKGYNLTTDGIFGERSQAAYADSQGLNTPLAFKNSLATASTPLPGKLSKVDITKATPAAARKPGVADKVAGGLQAGASIYNLGQGLFGKVDKTVRREYSPELMKYEDMSAPQRKNSKAAMKAQVSTARNLSGGSAGNMRANANQAFADDFNRQSAIDNQEAGRKLDVNNSNVGLKNEAKLRNMQMNDQADNLDAQNKGRKSELLAKGLEGIGALAANSVLQKNTLAKEAADRDMLGNLYGNFTIENGKMVFKKQRNGVKKIKK